MMHEFHLQYIKVTEAECLARITAAESEPKSQIRIYISLSIKYFFPLWFNLSLISVFSLESRHVLDNLS